MTLTPSQSATVGTCYCHECDLDLRVEFAEAPTRIGRVQADTDFWSLSNLSAEAPLTVANMDDWNQYIVLEPGRRDVPVPFEVAQIELSATPEGPRVSVFGYEPRYVPARRFPACGIASPPRPLLDHRSTYFSVLRELCRPRLCAGLDIGLPSSEEIADRLRPRYPTINRRAVDAHIQYLSEKLHLPKGAGRETLVALALRSDLLQQRT